MKDKWKRLLGLQSQEERRQQLLNEIINVKEINGSIFIVIEAGTNYLKLPLDLFKEGNTCRILQQIREANYNV